jgi:hypothetical protein
VDSLPDTDPVDIDLDRWAGEPDRPDPRRRPRRGWWVAVGLAALLVVLTGSTAARPAAPTRPVSVQPLPSAVATFPPLDDHVATELPPGAASGASPWCRTSQLHGGHVVLVPCGEAYPR